jgi:hypothetical protein
MTSHDSKFPTEAPDVPSSIRLELYRRVTGLNTWLDLRIDSADPWVPDVSMRIESDHLTVEDHSHKGMAEKILMLLRPAIQAMTQVLVADSGEPPIDL